MLIVVEVEVEVEVGFITLTKQKGYRIAALSANKCVGSLFLNCPVHRLLHWSVDQGLFHDYSPAA